MSEWIPMRGCTNCGELVKGRREKDPAGPDGSWRLIGKCANNCRTEIIRQADLNIRRDTEPVSQARIGRIAQRLKATPEAIEALLPPPMTEDEWFDELLRELGLDQIPSSSPAHPC